LLETRACIYIMYLYLTLEYESHSRHNLTHVPESKAI